MRVNSKRLVVFLLSAVIPLSGCAFIQKMRARDNLNKGVKAFTEQKYALASQYFEKSIQQDPEFDVARMYLATTYTSQYIPGSTDPESEEMAQKGITTFTDVAGSTKDPEQRKNAMLSIASLYYQLRKYDESKDWCNRILKFDPQNAEAYYRIAVIDYDDSLRLTGLQGENVEFMTPEEKTATQQHIDEGLKALDQALQMRPDFFDAMEYQNLLWREMVKFEKDEKVKAELIRQADLVAQKSLALRLKAQEEEAKKPKKLGISK